MEPPRGASGWPARLGLLALIGAWLSAQVVIGFLAVFFDAAGGSYKDAGFIVAASIIQGLIFVAVSVTIVRSRGPVTARDFGLVRTPFASTAGKAAIVFVLYLVAFGVYSMLVHLKADDTPEKLGADHGSLGMVAFVVMATLVAPFAEEFLFRGVVFRAFANGMGVFFAALLSGLLFGALHVDSFAADRLLQVVPLAGLGFLFALLYAWSGTLFATIALHATNNALAVGYYAAGHDSTLGLALAPLAWVLMMVFCTFGWRFTDPGEDSNTAAAVV